MRYGLKGNGRTRPNFFRVVLGPCAQFYPCEAKIWPKWAQILLKALFKNPSPLVSQEFSILTAAKESWKNINSSRSY